MPQPLKSAHLEHSPCSTSPSSRQRQTATTSAAISTHLGFSHNEVANFRNAVAMALATPDAGSRREQQEKQGSWGGGQLRPKHNQNRIMYFKCVLSVSLSLSSFCRQRCLKSIQTIIFLLSQMCVASRQESVAHTCTRTHAHRVIRKEKELLAKKSN